MRIINILNTRNYFVYNTTISVRCGEHLEQRTSEIQLILYSADLIIFWRQYYTASLTQYAKNDISTMLYSRIEYKIIHLYTLQVILIESWINVNLRIF